MHTFSFSNVITYGLLLLVPMVFVVTAHSQATQNNNNLPVIYGIKLDGTRLSIDVASSGCTDASYFSVQIALVSPDTYHLSIIQNKEDRCRMSVHVITVMLDIPALPNLAEARFVLLNRLATPVTLLRSNP